jgi:hypothetical protein
MYVPWMPQGGRSVGESQTGGAGTYPLQQPQVIRETTINVHTYPELRDEILEIIARTERRME